MTSPLIMTSPERNLHQSRVPISWYLLRLNIGSPHPRGVLTVWRLWERWYEYRHPVHLLTPHSLLRYARSRAQHTHTFENGTVVTSGAPVLELHFNNAWLSSLTSHSPWRLIVQLHTDLLVLQQLLKLQAFADIEALHGITIFGSPARRFGFDVVACKHNIGVRFERYFMAGLIMLYHPDGWNAVRHAAIRWPYELWLDRATLMHLL